MHELMQVLSVPDSGGGFLRTTHVDDMIKVEKTLSRPHNPNCYCEYGYGPKFIGHATSIADTFVTIEQIRKVFSDMIFSSSEHTRWSPSAEFMVTLAQRILSRVSILHTPRFTSNTPLFPRK